METGSTATSPLKKRKSPTPSSTEGKPKVAVTRVVSDKHFVVSPERDDVRIFSATGKFTLEDEGDAIVVTKPEAQSLISCLKLFLGGRGTGTPRKK